MVAATVVKLSELTRLSLKQKWYLGGDRLTERLKKGTK
ncbi:hypothetical protein SAMN05443244_1229 [Terriglobus roseus]|uniref:Uncharacterized protein n=1 Tax=Terriglobus roseus TaxID=392734 RepID=A0A1H4KJJ6_9BACT|nr:hypothetical protein SAMN05443244_1229 [Terriglobus roseus]